VVLDDAFQSWYVGGLEGDKDTRRLAIFCGDLLQSKSWPYL